MLRLSRKTDYALVLITALARAQGRNRGKNFFSVRELARELHLPYRFASHVVTVLARKGLLESREGINGGYRLAKDPKTITIGDVLGATERGVALVSCLQITESRCPQTAVCPAQRGVPVLQRLVLGALGRYTIADLLRDGHGAPLRHD